MKFWRYLLAFVFSPLCFGGSSSSTSEQKYITNDSRVAGGQAGSVAVGSGGANAGGTANTVTTTGPVNITDTNAASFARLLDTLDRINALEGQSLADVMHSADGIAQLAAAQGQSNSGGLDNKTIALLVVAGVVGLVVIARKG